MTRQDGDASQTAADDALQSLVQQFSERSAFVRELVQNALDAGSGSIEVNLCVQRGCLKVDVVDDGEGMDRDIIEKALPPPTPLFLFLTSAAAISASEMRSLQGLPRNVSEFRELNNEEMYWRHSVTVASQ